MPAKVIWSLGSLADLTAIVSYIAADNPAAARQVGGDILQRTRQLEVFPLSGRYFSYGASGEIR